MSSKFDDRQWVHQAVYKILADQNRSSDTHLIKVDVPCFGDKVALYLKDESTHPSGSLKHRLARSLFLYGLCNGDIHQRTPIIESSSGSTAISEAYFARMLGLRFIAVVPMDTAPEKLEKIEFYGGECIKVRPDKVYVQAQSLAQDLRGYYMDQFSNAERVTDWRGNNNIAESIFEQMKMEAMAVPEWIVVGAGTGGTSATIGRYVRYRADLYGKTKVAVVDPENSVFYDYFVSRESGIASSSTSLIEGIGRPRVEPSFQPNVVDMMMRIPDAASIACVRWLETVIGKKCGGSTGTSVYGALKLLAAMMEQNKQGSVVSLICDAGERYLESYYNDIWLEEREISIAPYIKQLEEFSLSGYMQELDHDTFSQSEL
ncbi:PLP-dependent cysteine synthase family protein [Pleionea sp. CnH1-48]|uniref:PLP-dependent cysteine synthase family protein n=1 Tax=Pleionea sp. CnH1-48 TaxID=2954494 RepID=UPI0020970FF1|nr:PLP-dependent cysteine synthase family protein [Pleionea sp. CnH1-48]MCO7223176.1 PLP-dependent cysteine synthase family protein [Pleionea sp. CnH1-48]